MHPPQSWRVFDSCGCQTRRQRGVRLLNLLQTLFIVERMCERHVRKTLPQLHHMRFRHLPKWDGPNSKNEYVHSSTIMMMMMNHMWFIITSPYLRTLRQCREPS